MNNSKDKFQNLFKVYEILLKNNIIETEFLIKWADKIIETKDEFDYAIIELSTESKNINNAISILNLNSQNSNNEIISRATIGILSNLFREQKVDSDKVAEIVNDIVYYNGLTIEENTFLYGFGDFYDLAAQEIYGNLDSLTDELIEYIDIYRAFNFINYEKWAEINSTVKTVVPQKLQIIKQKYSL